MGMNKNDLKKLVVCGFALGCLSVAQGAVADEKTQENILVTTEKTQEDVLVTTEKTQENIFVAGCKGGCGNKSAPKNGRALTPEEEQQIQGQGQGHGCAGKPQGQPQQGHSCAGRSQPRPYQV